MSLSAIRDRIKTILQGVTGIGVVHDYERWDANWTEMLAHYKSSGVLNGWAITRRGTSEDWDNMPVVERYHNFEISGIYSLSDATASEKTFQNLVDAVAAALRNDQTLGGACIVAGPVNVEAVEPRMFGSVLCHYCLIKLPVHDREIQG